MYINSPPRCRGKTSNQVVLLLASQSRPRSFLLVLTLSLSFSPSPVCALIPATVYSLTFPFLHQQFSLLPFSIHGLKQGTVIYLRRCQAR